MVEMGDVRRDLVLAFFNSRRTPITDRIKGIESLCFSFFNKFIHDKAE